MKKTKVLFTICAVGIASLIISCSNAPSQNQIIPISAIPEDPGENPGENGENPEDPGENPGENGENPEDPGENPGDNGENPEDTGENPEDNGETTPENNPIEYQFHETVEYLPAGTDGTAGTTGTYVLFGDWPQTIKAQNVEIDTTRTMVKGGFTYYKGSDLNWYVSRSDSAYAEGYVYSDGTTVGKYPNNSIKYFKVEPIKWRVLNPNPSDGAKKFLLAERCLIAGQIFDLGNSRSLNNQTIYGNNYRFSKIRAYLNGTVTEYKSIKLGENIPINELGDKNKGFLYSAFTVSAIDKIADTLVKNDLESTGDVSNTYICEDTIDKIFLPSFQEMNNTEYGFSENETRIREATDYAKASGMKLTEGGWLLRSPSRSLSDVIYRVHSNGGFYSNNYRTTASIDYELGPGMKYAYAIVPALCLN